MTSRDAMLIFGVMANDRPDGATGDSVILVRVHAFLAALLTFLGFGHIPDATVAGMLDELTGWLDMAKAIRRDPQGATARIWKEAFFAAWNGGEKRTDHAEKMAVEVAAAFGRHFLPVAEDDRDTFDSADFDAMREQLDEADRFKSEICEALDGRGGAKAFYHAQLVDGLRAERDALLKTNAHHAGEIETLRQERDELKARLAGTIVPLSKPERVERRQKWALVMYVDRQTDKAQERVHFDIGMKCPPHSMIAGQRWYYLGKDA